MGILWGLLGFNEVYGVLMDFLGVPLIKGGASKGMRIGYGGDWRKIVGFQVGTEEGWFWRFHTK